MEEREQAHVATVVTTTVGDAAAIVLTPFRTAAFLAVGGTALAVQAAQRGLSSALGEGERQLDLFAKSVRRSPLGLWPLVRRGARSAQDRRSSRSSATG